MAKIVCKKCYEVNNDIDSFCKDCKTPFTKEDKLNFYVEDPDVAKSGYSFVSMPIAKLIIFSVISLGFYLFFWHFKQWRAVNKSGVEEKKVSPFLRALVTVIFFPFLVSRVYKNSKDENIDSPVVLFYFAFAGSFFYRNIVDAFAGRVPYLSLALLIILPVIFFVCIISAHCIIQRKINNDDSSVNEATITKADIVFIILFAVFAASDIYLLKELTGKSGKMREQVPAADVTKITGVQASLPHDHTKGNSVLEYTDEFQTFPGGFVIYTPEKFKEVSTGKMEPFAVSQHSYSAYFEDNKKNTMGIGLTYTEFSTSVFDYPSTKKHHIDLLSKKYEIINEYDINIPDARGFGIYGKKAEGRYLTTYTRTAFIIKDNLVYHLIAEYEDDAYDAVAKNIIESAGFKK